MIKKVLILVILLCSVANANLLDVDGIKIPRDFTFGFFGNLANSNYNGTSIIDYNGNAGSFVNAYGINLDGVNDTITVSSNGHDMVLFKGDSFSQLVVNSGFEAWTADDPDGWSPSPEDATNYISQEGNKARFISDGSYFLALQGPVLPTVDSFFMFEIKVDEVSSGSMVLRNGNDTESYGLITSTGTKRSTHKVSVNTAFSIKRNGVTNLLIDYIRAYKREHLWYINGDNIIIGTNGAEFSSGNIAYFITYNHNKMLSKLGSVEALQTELQALQNNPELADGYDSSECLRWIIDPTIETVLAPKIYAEGDNIVVNGEFETDSEWIKGSGITITGNQMVAIGANSAGVAQVNALLTNNKFVFENKIVSFDGGNGFRFSSGGGGYSGKTWDTVGVHREVVEPSAGGIISFGTVAIVTGNIDYLRIYPIESNVVGKISGASLTTTGASTQWNNWKSQRNGLYFNGELSQYGLFSNSTIANKWIDGDKSIFIAFNAETQGDHSLFRLENASNATPLFTIGSSVDANDAGMRFFIRNDNGLYPATIQDTVFNGYDNTNKIFTMTVNTPNIVLYLSGDYKQEVNLSSTYNLTLDRIRVGNFSRNGSVYCVLIYPYAMPAQQVKDTSKELSRFLNLGIF